MNLCVCVCSIRSHVENGIDESTVAYNAIERDWEYDSFFVFIG
jgi:hypothetical protein